MRCFSIPTFRNLSQSATPGLQAAGVFLREASWVTPILQLSLLVQLETMQDGLCMQLSIGGMPDPGGAMIGQSDLKDLGDLGQALNISFCTRCHSL